ncbi:hypothetical protein E5A74_14625 [Sphingomonas naasensis]|uniref:Uncharacterized protein n=1 Tax=Sphingomonas naasensis TaxID=1344951 RepID=A0A4V3QW20_9SPHN|nr:hypothetical protein E5A74_14625 [Sphingomonas naasensis]
MPGPWDRASPDSARARCVRSPARPRQPRAVGHWRRRTGHRRRPRGAAAIRSRRRARRDRGRAPARC